VLSRIAEKLIEINGTDFLRNGIRREGVTREEFAGRFNDKKQSVSMLYQSEGKPTPFMGGMKANRKV